MNIYVFFRRFANRCRRGQLSASCGFCCLILVVLVNVYLLHTSPSPWMHTHGGILPRRMGMSWPNISPCGPLRFVEPHGVTTALASVPGSGNTWVRHLLQQATGLMTGSFYNDTFLKTSGFPGEGVHDGSVLLVKTHDSHLDVSRHFQRAVLLLRKPRDATLAEFNRQYGGHVGYADRKNFEDDWESYFSPALDFWVAFNKDWLQFAGPLHIIRFEDLQLNLNATFSNLLAFLNMTVSSRNLQCALQHSDGLFKRRKSQQRSAEDAMRNIFTLEMRKRLEESEADFRAALNMYSKRIS